MFLSFLFSLFFVHKFVNILCNILCVFFLGGGVYKFLSYQVSELSSFQVLKGGREGRRKDQ